MKFIHVQHILVFTIVISCNRSIPSISDHLECGDIPYINEISTDDTSIHYYSFEFLLEHSITMFTTCNQETPSLDTKITLYDLNMTVIAINDDTEDEYGCLDNVFASTLIIDNLNLTHDTYYISVSHYNESYPWYQGTFGIEAICVPLSGTLECNQAPSFGSIINDTELYIYTIHPPVNHTLLISTCNQYNDYDAVIMLYDIDFNLILVSNETDIHCEYNEYAATIIGITSFDNQTEKFYVFVSYWDYPLSIETGDFAVDMWCWKPNKTEIQWIYCNEEPLFGGFISGDEGVDEFHFILPEEYSNVVFTTRNHYTNATMFLYFARQDEIPFRFSEFPDGYAHLYIPFDDLRPGDKYVLSARGFNYSYGYYGIQAFCYDFLFAIDSEQQIISCDTRDNDTCYIRLQLYDYYNFGEMHVQCNDTLPNCVVDGVYIGTDNEREPYRISMDCPKMNCNKCSVNCIGYFWCHGIAISGQSCSLLEVNVYDDSHIHYSYIYAPYGGDLIINVYSGGYAAFLNIFAFNIWSNETLNFTNNIIFNVEGLSVAEDVDIDAKYIIGTLDVKCMGFCFLTDIICPDASDRCNIECSAQKNDVCACCHMNVYQPRGINGANWSYECNDYAAYCASKLYCSADYVASTEVFSTWVQDENGWKYDNQNCQFDQKIVLSRDGPLIVSISGGCLLLLIVVICGSVYFYRYQREKKTLYITNGLVLLVSIGDYDDEIEPDDTDIKGYLDDLKGIEHDIQHMMDLFRVKLNYQVYSSDNDDPLKTYWTEHELKDFLEKKAKYLQQNVMKNKNYDGLVVILSCHGIPGYIVTSDYKIFSKLAIHRIFSAIYPVSRHIPRIFLYDCCSGSDEQVGVREDEPDDTGKNITPQRTTYDEVAKNVEPQDIHDGKDVASWALFENNPDYKLAVIEAANPGFQSKLTSETGSYVIHGFYKRAMENLERNKKLFIHEIFDDIQSELHDKGKQHPTYIWNDNTRYVRFKHSDKQQDGGNVEGVSQLEMTLRSGNKNKDLSYI